MTHTYTAFYHNSICNGDWGGDVVSETDFFAARPLSFGGNPLNSGTLVKHFDPR